jgi:hypothetical protein
MSRLVTVRVETKIPFNIFEKSTCVSENTKMRKTGKYKFRFKPSVNNMTQDLFRW